MQDSLTSKHKKILEIIFRFRFLTSNQIQKLLNHADKSRVNKWLGILTSQTFIGRIYNKNDGESRSAGVYFLDKKGLTYIKNVYSIDTPYFQKLTSEEKISLITRNHSLKGADFFLLLDDYATQNSHILKYFTKVDLSVKTLYKIVKPDAYFTYETPIGKKNAFIEIDLETESKITFNKKINKYINLYFTFKWHVPYTDKFPTICIICITQDRQKTLLHELENILEKYHFIPINFKVTTFQEIESKGIMSKVWSMPYGKESVKLV